MYSVQDSKNEQKKSILKDSTKLILDAIEISKKHSIEENRNLTFENGFIEGVLTTTQLIMETVFETSSLASVGIVSEGVHRASHILLGEFADKEGKCEFLTAIHRDMVIKMIASGVKKMTEMQLHDAKKPLDN